MKEKNKPSERMVEVNCNGWIFLSNFDSGNLGKVEAVDPFSPKLNTNSQIISENIDFEFNIWTKPDCAGTEFENGNRTWFYFGMREGQPFSTVKINIVNLNKQYKMYAQGMAPVYKIVPGKIHWERIKDKPTFSMEDKQFTVSFTFRFGDTRLHTVYFAFTYPYTYTELLNHLVIFENHCCKNRCKDEPKADDIYFHRELLTNSLQSRRVELITISSHHWITKTREPRLPYLFPDQNTPRCYKFMPHKKIIFLSARVHPGETPSSFVMEGMLNFLTTKDDLVAATLRKHFVFKLIPMLNPDGVYCGHYRTDTRGVNLNRVYGSPSPSLHPSIYGARTMVRFYHHGYFVPEPELGDKTSSIEERVSGLCLNRSMISFKPGESATYKVVCGSDSETVASIEPDPEENQVQVQPDSNCNKCGSKVKNAVEDSGIFLYIDMHGHTSKKGIFMYGNHFENLNMKVECMLFPKLITLYSQHFLFDSCNFTEKNMYIRDKRDGSSREGCGRVAVYKATGLIRCYTLECNYNTGKNLNMLPPPCRDSLERRPHTNLIVPPKYTPVIYEEAGKSILSALLDLIGMHPNTRLINSAFRSLASVRDVLRKRLMIEEMTADKDEIGDKRRMGNKLSVRKIRANKDTRPRVARTDSIRVRRGTQESIATLPGRKGTEKKKKKKSKEEGTSSSRRRIEKKCSSALESRRLPLEHRRKKLKPK